MTTAPDGGGLTEAEREALYLALYGDEDVRPEWYRNRSTGELRSMAERVDRIVPIIERILAARSTAPDTEAIAAAEQRGREDNSEHSMCYVSGSRALAAREAAALESAADEFPRHRNPVGINYVRDWLRVRAAGVREGSDT